MLSNLKFLLVSDLIFDLIRNKNQPKWRRYNNIILILQSYKVKYPSFISDLHLNLLLINDIIFYR